MLSLATWTLGVALSPGDKVAVIGASGNVGKLVALRLAETYDVRGVVRNSASVRSFLPDSVELFEADLCGGATPAGLEAALAGAACCVICTGTTAFPTQAWSKAGDEGVFTRVLKALFTQDLADQGEELNAFELTKRRWQAMIATMDTEGYNTPKNVDELANLAILKAWEKAAGDARKRLVLLSSIGVQRREQMPFPILNACGVLDAKATAEAAIQADAEAAGYSWTIVRPGQLNGGPYDNNYYLGTLFQLDKDADTREVTLGRGDELIGDTLRSTLAEVTAQALETNTALDLDFACVNVKGDEPSVEVVRQRLAAL